MMRNLAGAMLMLGTIAIFPSRNVIIALEGQEYDLGVGFVGDVIEHVFVLENIFDEALTITGMESSCGCTVLGAVADRIPPHSFVRVPVTVHLDRPEESFGQYVTLFFQEGPPVRLNFKGRIVHQVPPLLDFGTVRRDQTVAQRFRVRSHDPDGITVTGIEANERTLEVGLDPDQTQPLVLVKLRASEIEGPVDEEIVLHTDDPQAPLQSVLVTGYVLAAVETEPRSPIALGLLNPGESRTVAIRLHSPYGETVPLLDVEVTPREFLRWEQQEEQHADASAVALHLTMTGGFQQRLLKAVARFHVSCGGQQCVVPIDVFALRTAPLLPTQSGTRD